MALALGAAQFSPRDRVARYKALGACVVRETSDTNSAKVGKLEPGVVVDVIKVGAKNAKGRRRLQLAVPAGWVSDVGKDGSPQLEEIVAGSDWGMGSIDISAALSNPSLAVEAQAPPAAKAAVAAASGGAGVSLTFAEDTGPTHIEGGATTGKKKKPSPKAAAGRAAQVQVQMGLVGGGGYDGGGSSPRDRVARYKALGACVVRETSDTNSAKVGKLEPGVVVDVIKVGAKNAKGRRRLQLAEPAGWVSDVGKDGSPQLEEIVAGSDWGMGSIDISAALSNPSLAVEAQAPPAAKAAVAAASGGAGVSLTFAEDTGPTHIEGGATTGKKKKPSPKAAAGRAEQVQQVQQQRPRMLSKQMGLVGGGGYDGGGSSPRDRVARYKALGACVVRETSDTNSAKVGKLEP
eukprot:SAG25_NODE_1888_length_2197_cov_3.686845_1_plen_404_part_10